MGVLGLLTYGVSKYLYKRAVRGLLEKCISIQEKAIKEFKPDIVVGSSFGGGICVLLAMRKIWTGKTILLAPAQKKMLQRAGISTKDVSVKNLAYCHLIHGVNDTVIDLQDSVELAETANTENIDFSIIDDDHGMDKTLKKQEGGLADMVQIILSKDC